MLGRLQPAPLPLLREEIGIFTGPAMADGSPSWTLHDPSNNRFYRMGWLEFEMISRWRHATAEEIVTRVNAETTLSIDAEDVEHLRRFLFACDLLHLTGPQATAHFTAKAKRMRESPWKWLLHNYLFTRIPLVRPDRFLTETYGLVKWVFSAAFFWAIGLTGLFGLYLVAREWDLFVDTFVDLFSIRGAMSFGVTLACLKVVHELGHAYTAKRYGCRVPTMGVALLVMVPVLYTDVNESWKLSGRGQRVAIGMAGVAAELCCAAIAMCAWGFLPPGPARTAAFLVATTTWVTTVLINLSPFMRYDGYYVLSDFLETPNLHTRAFALARWWLREKLFGFGDPPPEDFPPTRQRFLITFALATWIYRVVLFAGIAAAIYHFVIKILGVAMAAVEVGFFVIRPIIAEFAVLWRRRADIRLSPRTSLTALGVVSFILLLAIPWRTDIAAPALLKSRQRIDLFAPEFGAQLVAVSVGNGDTVKKGALLMRLTSPDIDHKIDRTRTEIEMLRWQMSVKGFNADLLAQSQVIAREYQTSLTALSGLEAFKTQLDIRAPIDGKFVDMAPDLEPGEWLAAKMQLGTLIDPDRIAVEAYIEEADLGRITVGDDAIFFAEADTRISLPLQIANVAHANTAVLADVALASIYGGPIPVRPPRKKELVPDTAIYRVTLMPRGEAAPPAQVLRGQVILHANAESFAHRLWRSLYAVFIRESGL